MPVKLSSLHARRCMHICCNTDCSVLSISRVAMPFQHPWHSGVQMLADARVRGSSHRIWLSGVFVAPMQADGLSQGETNDLLDTYVREQVEEKGAGESHM